MSHHVALLGIFALIAVAYHTASHRAALHSSLPWITIAAHPVTLDTLRDMAVHILVYSHLSPLAGVI